MVMTEKEKKAKQKIYNKNYYDANRKRLIEKKSQWQKDNKDKVNVCSARYKRKNDDKFKEYYQEHKGEYAKRQSKYQKDKLKNNPEYRRKFRLRQMSRQISGSLKGKSCINCNSTEDLHRHHPSYDSYDFIILCRKCHQDLHDFLSGRGEYNEKYKALES